MTEWLFAPGSEPINFRTKLVRALTGSRRAQSAPAPLRAIRATVVVHDGSIVACPILDLFKLRPARVRHDRDVATVAIEKLGNSLAKIFHRTLVWTLLRGLSRLRLVGVLKRFAALGVTDAKLCLNGNAFATLMHGRLPQYYAAGLMPAT